MIITMIFASSTTLIYHIDMKIIELNSTISEDIQGLRLDQALARLFPEYSRAKLQQWIKDGHVQIDGSPCKQRDKVALGQKVDINATLSIETPDAPEDIPLNLVYEDSELLIINKPSNIVVHPGAGNKAHTLLNALLNHAPELANLPRAGIIHRLDKDTSGLLVVTKTLESHTHIVNQMQKREVKREYIALVHGEFISGATIEAPIGRHPKQRTKMAVAKNGKDAVTHYRIKQRFEGFTLLDIQLETGRTHQIRVHMAHINHPIVGDKAYGRKQHVSNIIQEFPRQALHAVKLTLQHPQQGELMTWECKPPGDIEKLLKALSE